MRAEPRPERRARRLTALGGLVVLALAACGAAARATPSQAEAEQRFAAELGTSDHPGTQVQCVDTGGADTPWRCRARDAVGNYGYADVLIDVDRGQGIGRNKSPDRASAGYRWGWVLGPDGVAETDVDRAGGNEPYSANLGMAALLLQVNQALGLPTLNDTIPTLGVECADLTPGRTEVCDPEGAVVSASASWGADDVVRLRAHLDLDRVRQAQAAAGVSG